MVKTSPFFPTSLWGFCFLACIPPAVVRRRPPSSAAALSHTHITKLISSYTSHVTSYTTHPTSHTTHLTHNSSHTTLISHTHITKLISYNLIHNSSHTPHLIHHITHHSSHTHTHITKLIIHTPHLIHHITHHSSHTHTHKTYLIIHKSSHIIHNSSHTQLILHTTHLTDSAWQAQYAELPEEGVARIVAAVAAARCCVAGAVHRAFCRSWGADCRRLGRAFSVRGRRNTQSLLKELRRGLSPAGPRLSFAWQAQYTEAPEGAGARIVAGWAAASLCVAGAVHRAFWRSCGADCRRLGRAFSLRGRRSTQRLLKELRRGLSPAGPRLLFAWQAQYAEAPEGAGARIVAGWAAASLCVAGAVHRAFWRSCGADCRRLGRGSPLRGRRSTQSLLKELGRGLSPAGPRLLSAWQAQYTEPSEGAAARIVAGWAAALLCVAGAVHRASRRSCGADCRRLGRGSPLCGRRSTQSLLKDLWRGLSPAGPRLSVAGAVHRASFRSWVADCRRLGRGFSLRGRRSTQSLLKELVAGAHTHTHTHTHTHAHTTHTNTTYIVSVIALGHFMSFLVIPHITVGFLFSCLHPAARFVRRLRLRRALLISHNSSHTQLISHTIHLTHNSSHTPLISHTIHLTQFISHNSSHTQLISHNSSHTQLISHTIHLTHNSSHTPLISHTTHLTQLITHNSSHTQLVSHNSSHTQLISTHLTQLISHNSSHTTHLTHLISQTCCLAGPVHRASWRSCGADCRRSWPRLLFVWQAQYTEPPEGAAARIVAAVAAAALCVAGAVHRASWRSCGADCRRSGRGCSLCGRRSTQSLLKELRRGLSPEWPRLLFVWQAQYT